MEAARCIFPGPVALAMTHLPYRNESTLRRNPQAQESLPRLAVSPSDVGLVNTGHR